MGESAKLKSVNCTSAGAHLFPGSTLKSIEGSRKIKMLELTVVVQLSKAAVRVIGKAPKVLKTTPFTSKSVELGMEALGPKSQRNSVELGPDIWPSKLKLLLVMQSESLLVNEIDNNSFKLMVAETVSEQLGEELPIKVTS